MDDLAQTRVAYGTVYLTQLYSASSIASLLNDDKELSASYRTVIDRVRSGRAHLYLRLRAERKLKQRVSVLRKLVKFSGFELDVTDAAGDLRELVKSVSDLGIPVGVRVTLCDESVLDRISKLSSQMHIQFVHVVGFDTQRTDMVRALFGGYTLHTFHRDWLLWSTKTSQPVYGLVDLSDATYRPLLNFPTELIRKRNVQTPRETGFQDMDMDYADTYSDSLHISPYTGWVILALTWVLVLTGLVAILDLWHVFPPARPLNRIHSYADFENDTGYPIPSYYPLLVCLLPAVLWVWCIVSWVGMKFFRHARADPL